MLDIDNEIEMLEKKLTELKKQKEAMDNFSEEFVNTKNDFKIKIYDHTSNEVAKYVDTFKELYNFWKSRMNKTDYIFLEYFDKGQYHSYEARTYEQYTQIIEIISQLNAHQIVSMDFTVCTKTDKFKDYAVIENDYLEFFHYDNNHTGKDTSKYFNITEDEYWNKMDEGKTFRLFEKST